jgi:hypothetical protein
LPHALCEAKAEPARYALSDAGGREDNNPPDLEGGKFLQIQVAANRCALRVWNPHTQTWWRTDLYQETVVFQHRQAVVEKLLDAVALPPEATKAPEASHG